MTEVTGRPNFGTRARTGAPAPQAAAQSAGTGSGNKRTEAGAIWKKETKAGKEYLTLSLKTSELENLLTKAKNASRDKVNLVAFSNDKGDNNARPDFRIYEENDRT